MRRVVCARTVVEDDVIPGLDLGALRSQAGELVATMRAAQAAR
jgi:hypothetical protein